MTSILLKEFSHYYALQVSYLACALAYKLSVTEFLAGQPMTQTECSLNHEKYSDLPQLAIELQMDSDGMMQPQAHSKVFHLVTAGSSSTLPWNIHSRRTPSYAWSTLKFSRPIFHDMKSITEIHENIVSQKFGAIRYSLCSSNNNVNIYIIQLL